MDSNFQDRIDEYLLHRDSMSEDDRARFRKEIEEDAEKRKQYEFTKQVKEALTSREQKLKAMARFEREMQRQKEPVAVASASPRQMPAAQESPQGKERATTPKRRKLWLWISSGIAAVLLVGFLITPIFHVEGPIQNGNVRGGDDVFDNGFGGARPPMGGSTLSDSLEGDTIIPDTIARKNK